MAQPRGSPDDDLFPILRRWQLEPGTPRVRYVDSADGKVRLQVRIEGGILQFECSGRPDGDRPEGFESWMAYWESNQGPIGPTDVACLQDEAALYRQRAAAYLALENYDAAAADCERNVKLLDIVRPRIARGGLGTLEAIGLASIFLATRARTTKAIQARDIAGAVAAIDRGLADVGRYSAVEAGGVIPGEAAILRAMRGALVPKLPSSQRVELEARLLEAIRTENFELAAILRDELRQIGY